MCSCPFPQPDTLAELALSVQLLAYESSCRASSPHRIPAGIAPGSVSRCRAFLRAPDQVLNEIEFRRPYRDLMERLRRLFISRSARPNEHILRGILSAVQGGGAVGAAARE